mgnify:CR=1 FL=1
MSEQDLIFQQYKLYSEQKESFISRSFMINRFYLCLSIILLLVAQIFEKCVFAYNIPLSTLISVIGMGATMLWWANMDAYNMLIKVKFSKVLEEIEKQLPVQPYGDEYKGIKEFRENKKMFLFSDMQKAFAVIIFIMFFLQLLNSVIPVIVKSIL